MEKPGVGEEVQYPTSPHEASSPHACRNQPGHQVCVRRPPQEEHCGEDCGDEGWRGEEVDLRYRPYQGCGCSQEFLRPGTGESLDWHTEGSPSLTRAP